MPENTIFINFLNY